MVIMSDQCALVAARVNPPTIVGDGRRAAQKSLRLSTTPWQGPGVQGQRRSPLPMRRDVTRRGFDAVEVGIYNVIHTIAAAVTSLDAGGGGVSGAARVVSRTARSKGRLWHDVSWVKA
jgi:hypothetical protein